MAWPTKPPSVVFIQVEYPSRTPRTKPRYVELGLQPFPREYGINGRPDDSPARICGQFDANHMVTYGYT